MFQYKEKKDIKEFSKLNVNTWNGIKDNVYLRLMNTKYMTEYDESILQTKFLDLSCVVSVQETVDSIIYSHLLTEKDIESYSIDFNTVYEQAMENTKNNRKKRIMPLHECLLSSSLLYPFASTPPNASMAIGGEKGGAPGVIYDIDEEGNENIVVVRNKNNCFGSSYIMLPDVLNEVYDRLSENFYILPMSIHEIWCVKSSFLKKPNKSMREIEDDLLDLVEQFNDTQNKSWKDILSYKLYYYFGDDGKKIMSIS